MGGIVVPRVFGRRQLGMQGGEGEAFGAEVGLGTLRLRLVILHVLDGEDLAHGRGVGGLILYGLCLLQLLLVRLRLLEEVRVL
jgi:hypothetical protein